MKNVRIDLFKGKFARQGKTFGQFLQEVNTLPKGTRFKDLGSEAALYMPNPRHIATEVWTGELQHIRKTNLPGKFDLRTQVNEALGLTPHEGLVESCHFAYRTDLDSLALQSSRYIKTNTFASYVSYVADTSFSLSLVLKSDAYHRLLRLRTIASVNLRIANPPDAEAFRRLNDPGVSAVADLLSDFGAAKLELTLKRERRGKITLAIQRVRDFIDKLNSQNADVAESVEGLCVTGKRDDEDTLEAVDFIKERMSLEGKVGYDAQRQLDPKGCTNLAVRALKEYERELRRYEQ